MNKTSEAPMKQQLEIAAKEKKNAAEALRQETEKQDLIESIRLEEIWLPKTEGALASSKTALEELIAKKEEMKALVEKANSVKTTISTFRNVERACEDVLYRTRLFAEAGEYGEAMQSIAELREYLELDFGFETKFKTLVEEILSWTLVKLTIADQKARSAYRRESLPLEVLLALKEDAKALPLNFHKQEEKDELLEEAFAFVGKFYLSEGNIDSLTGLGDRFLEVAEYARLSAEHRADVERVFSLLREGSVKAFDRFARSFDSADACYEDALFLFRLRGHLSPEEILSPLFREPQDERSFRLAFLKNVCFRQDEDAFASYAVELQNTLVQDTPEIIDLIAGLYLDNRIDEEKKKHLNLLYTRISFERKIEVLSRLLDLGVDEEMFLPLYGVAESTKKKTIDLEARADSLLCLKEKAPSAITKSVEGMIASLLRSPHACRVIEKSSNPSLTKLRSPKAKYHAPIGKKEKNPYVKEWSEWKLATYWGLLGVLPLLATAIVGCYLYFYQLDNPYFPFLFLIPVLLPLIVGVIFVYHFSGRDERASAIVRRLYGLLGLASAAMALIYYADPHALPQLEPFGYSFVGSGFLFLLLGQFAFVDRKKVWNYILFLPLLLVEIAALILLVMGAMGH